jgi:glyoxylase-like metal-dependent hydrolase (beta-lactamase superfamily II)
VTALELEPAGGWRAALLRFGRARHPGEWVGPGFPEWMWTPMNGLLLQGRERTILVDTGSGALTHLWPFEGIESSARAALEAAGVEPLDVDTVVLTHLDDDHIGGLVDGTWPGVEPAFPRARVLAPREAVAAVEAGQGLPTGIDERRRLLRILRETGVLDEALPGDEVAPGIRLRDAPGHRAGHVCVEVDGPRPLVHVADTLHHESHVEHPDWDRIADEDPARALATRLEVLAELASTGAQAVASHLPRPFGVAAAGEGFEVRPGGQA